MLFNSLEFAVFLPIVFVIYWALGSDRRNAQNVLLLVASYIFYGWWDYRFLALIAFSSLVDFIVGAQLPKSNSGFKRKFLLAISIVVNIGLLGVFKYFNFFVANFVEAFSFFGYRLNPWSLKVILPVGISFYTFQTLSYTIDIYREKLKPTSNLIAFFSYVSFFPQLVAGPIERASNLLPQFLKNRRFDYFQAKDGLRQILWGLFKKIVIADTCAIYANDIFNNYENYSSIVLVAGAVYFAFQIYGDFSGSSDIAIGTAKLFGLSIMRNFAYPYFSRDIAEFWRRWHISLSSWFRDYLYIPLGGSKGNTISVLRNVLVIFLVSGFWHGANWTFIVWGGLNAVFFFPLLVLKKNRHNLGDVAQGRILPSVREALSMLFTFGLVTLAWVFFRAENLSHALNYLMSMAECSFSPFDQSKFKYAPLILLLVSWEWLARHKQHGLVLERFPTPIRWFLYLLLVWFILYYFGEEQEFIYFQF